MRTAIGYVPVFLLPKEEHTFLQQTKRVEYYMIGCTRCGSWHKDAETAEGKKLSCTEVKQHWIKVRKDHNDRFGHYPKIIRNDDGKWICIECKKEL